MLVDKVAAEENRINAARKALIAAMERRADVNRSVGELSAERVSLTDQIEELKMRMEIADRQNFHRRKCA